VGLLDAKVAVPRSKVQRYAISGVALVILLAFGVWYFYLRFLGEKRAVASFMDALVAEQFEDAYQIWNPHGSYTYEDFLADWSPNGYYGPIKSYHIYSASSPSNASGTVVVVEISPEAAFPAQQDPKSASTRVVSIWVEASDLSLSFPPSP
jgi:hypothetical protein